MLNRAPDYSPIAWLVTTALAWLGLAGLSEAFVEWQSWFEQGIMQHWRSVKVWVIAVCFDWLPFKLPPWVLDYLVVGGICAKAASAFQINRYSRIVVTYPNEGYWHRVFSGWLYKLEKQAPISGIMLLFIFWPFLLIYHFSIWGKARNISPASADEIELLMSGPESWPNEILWAQRTSFRLPETLQDIKEHYSSIAKRYLIFFLGFIPVLFACSTLLYEFG